MTTYFAGTTNSTADATELVLLPGRRDNKKDNTGKIQNRKKKKTR